MNTNEEIDESAELPDHVYLRSLIYVVYDGSPRDHENKMADLMRDLPDESLQKVVVYAIVLASGMEEFDEVLTESFPGGEEGKKLLSEYLVSLLRKLQAAAEEQLAMEKLDDIAQNIMRIAHSADRDEIVAKVYADETGVLGHRVLGFLGEADLGGMITLHEKFDHNAEETLRVIWELLEQWFEKGRAKSSSEPAA